MNKLHKIVFLSICVVIGTSIGCRPKPGGPPPTTIENHEPKDPKDSLTFDHLSDQSFGEYKGPFSGRTPAPAISSYRQDPINALGSIFAKIAKQTKNCNSTNVDDYEYRRIIEQRPEACQSKAFPATTVASILVDGRATADITYIVGAASVSAEYAFEFIVSEPVTAVLLNTESCVIDTKINKLKLPERTCDLQYIAGVVVTQVSYRKFRKIAASANASYVVKVGGEAYGSSEQLVNKWYMTVDTLDLTRFFETDSTSGFLEKISNETTNYGDLKSLRPSETKDEFIMKTLEHYNASAFVPERGVIDGERGGMF